MGTTVTRGFVATLLVLLMAVGSVVMWLVAPVFWLWLASQIASSSQPSLSIYLLVLVGIVASMIVIGKLLGWLNRLHAMGTSLEGPTEDVLALVGELHAIPFAMGIPRVYTVLKLDERRDREQTLDDKVASVERLLADGGEPG